MHAVWRRLAFWCVPLAFSFAGGCSNFNRRDAALDDYSATHRRIEGDRQGVRPAAYEEETGDESLTDGINSTFQRMTGNAPNPELAKQLKGDGDALYQTAVQALQQEPSGDHTEKFLAAAGKFSSAARKWPDSTVEQDALFLESECYFFADRYPKAQDHYERLLKKYPNSRYLDRVQPRRFAIADYWLSLQRTNPQSVLNYNVSDNTRPGRDTFGEAIRTFDRIRLDDPTGKLADDATLAMGNAFFNRGEFIRADENYEDLRKTFPSSEHQFRAHFLGLKAKLMNYQGPEYSGYALAEAEKLYEQIRKQFPVESRQESEYLARASAEIRYRKAEREWHMAQHYDRRAEFGAARFYYRTLAVEFIDTPFAQKAQQRLGEIGGQPDDPPQNLGWVVRLFPEEESVKPLLDTTRR